MCEKVKDEVVLLHAMKEYGGMDVWLHSFLTLLLDGGERPPTRLGRFTFGERALASLWIGGLVAPIAGLDAVE